MLALSVTINVILGLLIVVLVLAWRGDRRRLYIAEGRDLGWPIPMVSLGVFDDRFSGDETGPSRDAEVSFIGTGDGVTAGTSDRESWVLAVLATNARRIFEFGTCTGKSTYLMARNSPADARVTTLTLGPEDHESYRKEEGDTRRAARKALEESTFSRFYYEGSPVAPKVEQLIGDSKAFDEEPYLASCDLVFIDGSHALSYVKNDTEKALRMLAPGGIIVWHDYRGPGTQAPDVFRYLNGLARERDLVHLQGTSLVAYRSAAIER